MDDSNKEINLDKLLNRILELISKKDSENLFVIMNYIRNEFNASDFLNAFREIQNKNLGPYGELYLMFFFAYLTKDIDNFFSMLSSEDEKLQLEILEAISYSEKFEAIPYLYNLLSSSNHKIRYHTSLILSHTKDINIINKGISILLNHPIYQNDGGCLFQFAIALINIKEEHERGKNIIEELIRKGKLSDFEIKEYQDILYNFNKNTLSQLIKQKTIDPNDIFNYFEELKEISDSIKYNVQKTSSATMETQKIVAEESEARKNIKWWKLPLIQ